MPPTRKATVDLGTLILMVPHLWYTLVTRQMLVVVMVVTRHFSPTGVLRTCCWMPWLFTRLVLCLIIQSNFSKYIELLPCISYSLTMITSSLKDFAKIFNTTVTASRLFGYIQFISLLALFLSQKHHPQQREFLIYFLLITLDLSDCPNHLFDEKCFSLTLTQERKITFTLNSCSSKPSRTSLISLTLQLQGIHPRRDPHLSLAGYEGLGKHDEKENAPKKTTLQRDHYSHTH